VAAIAYFAKTHEDAETVTYRYGRDEEDLGQQLTIDKAGPLRYPDGATLLTRLALSGIVHGYRKLGRWPDQGFGAT
jgi:hypothetical protein